MAESGGDRSWDACNSLEEDDAIQSLLLGGDSPFSSHSQHQIELDELISEVS